MERYVDMSTVAPLNWLVHWRHSHTLTQAAAAALFGVHPVTYARWELGERALEGAALRLAQMLQTPQGMRLARQLLTAP